ncbi:MAG: SoxR reducing system RseC family protein [Methylotenera sp.]|nr:SoxR reducing system RseC family protein [Methylotenera sp.]
MIEEHAIVIETNEHQAVLEIERKTACGLCGQKRGCGNATWGKLRGHQAQVLRADNVIGVHVGESVVIGVDERYLLKTVGYLYLVPLLGLLAGALLADAFFQNQFYVMLVAALGLVLALMWVKRHLQNTPQSTCHTPYQAVILRHADDTSVCENKKTNCASAGHTQQ